MDKDFGVVYVKKRGDIRVKVTINIWYDVLYLHIREYGFDGDTGNLFPTKKGITIDPDELDTLIEKLQEVSQYIAKSYKKSEQLEFKL